MEFEVDVLLLDSLSLTVDDSFLFWMEVILDCFWVQNLLFFSEKLLFFNLKIYFSPIVKGEGSMMSQTYMLVSTRWICY
jgi:hypothetical protein